LATITVELAALDEDDGPVDQDAGLDDLDLVCQMLNYYGIKP